MALNHRNAMYFTFYNGQPYLHHIQTGSDVNVINLELVNPRVT